MDQVIPDIGPYKVEAEIGRGGMGVVYRAADPRLGRTVAIKTLPEDFADDEERLARFKIEARILASLNHPNVAGIHGIEEHEGLKFLVLEFVDGETLAERLDRGPLSVGESMEICEQIAAGVEAAHEAGIVHRDIKPGNIKLTPEGKVKVLDFGLAKSTDAGSSSSMAVTQTPTVTAAHSPTAAGVILGTAPYMSPEQARGRPVDRRSDIWSFGVVLYECLSGICPFVGETVSDSIAAILQVEVDLDRLPATTPGPVRRTLRRCLERDKDRRYRHMGDVRLDLLEARDGAEELLVHEHAPGRSKLAWGVAAAALLALAALAGWFVTRPQTERVRLVTEIVPRDPSAEVSVRGGPPALSPDGERLAYMVERGSEMGLLVRDLTTGAEHSVTLGSDIRGAFWSPDSRSLGYFERDRLMIVPSEGARPEPVAGVTVRSSFFSSGAWGADGSILFGRVPDGLVRTHPFEGGVEQILDPFPDRVGDRVEFPSLLPDGHRFIFTLFESENEGPTQIVAGEAGLQEFSTVLPVPSNAVVTPAGRIYFVRSGRLHAQPFDVDRATVVGEPMLVAHDVRMVSWPPYALFSVGGSGRVAYIPGGNDSAESEFVWIDRSSGEITPMDISGSLWNPRLSPDGRFLAYDRTVEEGKGDIWIRDLERGLDAQLTRDPKNESDPVWTPDGETVIFFRGDDLYRISTDGVSEAELVLAGEGANPFAVTPDGRTLVYTETLGDSASVKVATLDLESREVSPWLDIESSTGFVALSPDGRWIAYTARLQQQFEVFVRSFPDGSRVRRVSVDGGDGPRWSRHNELFFASGTNLMAARVAERSNGEIEIERPRQVATLPPTLPAGCPFEVTADGQRFLTPRNRKGESRTIVRVLENWDAGDPESR